MYKIQYHKNCKSTSLTHKPEIQKEIESLEKIRQIAMKEKVSIRVDWEDLSKRFIVYSDGCIEFYGKEKRNDSFR